MLKVESVLPGFGGFYLDSLGRVIVYMKPSAAASIEAIRGTMTSFYSNLPNPLERQAMSTSRLAVVVPGLYSLSELIAVENRVATRLLSVPGIVGVGTSLRLNRVKVGFRDSSSLEVGIQTLLGAGVPRDALIPEVWGEPQMTSTFADRIRNTRAGPMISVGRRYDPTDGKTYGMAGSHGFTVTKPDGTKYVMTAAHLATMQWGINGKTADTVWQATYNSLTDSKAGMVTINAPYLQSNNCPLDSASQAYPDYCSQSDVMLATFNWATPDKKVATSTYEGQNGNPGNPNINGYYSIEGVMTPEYVRDYTNKGVHKSGFATGTTTGVIDVPLAKVLILDQLWGSYHYSNPAPTISFVYYNVTRVAHIGWGSGDSGGPVFAGNGSPYVALGMQVSASGHRNSNAVCDDGTACAIFFTRWANIEQDIGFTLNPITGQ
jgi:hypothetical protein